MDKRKIFISYCWTTAEHEDWVITLANRLVQDGVDVVFDKWDLKEGHDKFAFMESMVNASEIDKVMIILDKKYEEKANDRSGGVGTETLIITPQVYKNAKQEKFIPIVAEVDENGQPYLPIYLTGRIYIDLSSEDHFELNYEKLLRRVYDRPSLVKPQLGTPPRYLFQETPMQFKTSTMLRSMDSQLDKHPNRINSLTKDFLDEFFKNLTEFVLDDKTEATYEEIGKEALSKLNQYKPLRNDYIEFIGKLAKTEIVFDSEILISFFERLPLLLSPLDRAITTWQGWRYAHFKLVITELFIYTVSQMLKYNKYLLLEDIFHSCYLIKERKKFSQQ